MSHKLTYMWNLKKENKNGTNEQNHTGRKQAYGYQGGRKGINWTFRLTYTHYST